MIDCFSILEIEKTELIGIFEILGSIIHMQNLSFVQKHANGNSSWIMHKRKSIHSKKRYYFPKSIQTSQYFRGKIDENRPGSFY